MANKKRGEDRRNILEFIQSMASRGSTCDEAELNLGLTHQNCSARFWELAGRDRKRPELKRIVESGERRKTRSGCWAQVYVYEVKA